MPRIWGKFLLFLGSYSPLFFICGVVFFVSKQVWISAGSFLFFLTGVIGTFIFLKFVKQISPRPFEIVKVVREDTQIMSYIEAYLIPFIVVIQPETTARQAIAFVLFFLLFAFIYVKSNIIWVNPLLSFVGFHIYKVTDKKGQDFTLITKKRRLNVETISVAILGNEILFERDN